MTDGWKYLFAAMCVSAFIRLYRDLFRSFDADEISDDLVWRRRRQIQFCAFLHFTYYERILY